MLHLKAKTATRSLRGPTARAVLVVAALLVAASALPQAAGAAPITLLSERFDSAVSGRPGWSTGTYKTGGDLQFSGAAPEVVFPGSGSPARYVSSPGSLWVAQDFFGSEMPSPVFRDIDGYYDVKVRIVAKNGTGPSAVADIDAVQSLYQAYGGIFTKLEAESSTSAVVRSGSWSAEASPRYSAGQTMLASSTPASIEFVFFGDASLGGPSADNPTRRVGILVGRLGAGRGGIDYEVSLRTPGAGWVSYETGSINEASSLYSSFRLFPSYMNGYARYALDLTPYGKATLRYWWYKPAVSAGADWTYVEIRRQSDGALLDTIQSIQPYTGWSRWYETSAVLGPSRGAGQAVWLQFRVTSDGEDSAEGVYFDDITVEAEIPDPPGAPTVSSFTHPSQSVWYANDNPAFVWTEPTPTVTDYSWHLDESATAVPDTTGEGGATATAFSGVADGTHYFHVRAYSDPLWGPSGTYRIRIDRTPPTQPEVVTLNATAGPTGPLEAAWSSEDTGSGVARYLYAVGTFPGASDIRSWTDVGREQTITATGLTLSGPKTYYISVKAVDSAGNTSTVGAPPTGTFVKGQSSVAMPVPGWTAVAGRPVTFNITASPPDARLKIIRRIGGLESIIGYCDAVGGSATFTDHPKQHATYWAEFDGDDQWLASQSAADVLRVKWRLGIAPYRWADDRFRLVRLKGMVYPAPPRGYVYLQQYFGQGRFRNVGRIRLSRWGTFYRAYFRLYRRGYFYLRLFEPSDTRHCFGYSRTIRLKAR